MVSPVGAVLRASVTGASRSSWIARALAMSADRVWRLWRQPSCRCRESVASTHRHRAAAAGRPHGSGNQVWAYDLVFDASANGQQLKCLTVLDEYTCESLAIDVAGLNCGLRRVIEVLAELITILRAYSALFGPVSAIHDGLSAIPFFLLAGGVTGVRLRHKIRGRKSAIVHRQGRCLSQRKTNSARPVRGRRLP